MSPRVVSLVVAYSLRTRAIGLRNGLPWPPLRQDLSRLRALTLGQTVIMGRRTFESVEMDGVPLPGRRHVVLSRDPVWAPPPGVVHAADWAEALMLADAGFGGGGYDDGTIVTRAGSGVGGNSVFVLGGEQVYRCALQGTDAVRIFATEIQDDFDGDVSFPKLNNREWRRIGDYGDGSYAEVKGPEFCPKGWAAAEPIIENGITYRFVTCERLTVPAVEHRGELHFQPA